MINKKAGKVLVILLVAVLMKVSCAVCGEEKASVQKYSKADVISQNNKLKAFAQSSAKEGIEVDIIKNSKLDPKYPGWQLHNCTMTARGVEFNNNQPCYSQLRQRIPIELPAGTPLRVEADIQVADPLGVIEEKKLCAQLQILFYADGGKGKAAIWGKNPRGCAAKLLPTGGEVQTFSIDMLVPDKAVIAVPTIKANMPLKMKVHGVRLIAKVSRGLAQKMGCDIPPQTVMGEPVNVADQFQRYNVKNELYPVALGKTIIVDGNASDWDDVTTRAEIDYVIPRMLPPNGPADASASFKAAMDKDNLYLLVTAKDDKLVFGKTRSYKDDSIEIYLSPTFNQKARSKTDTQIVVAPHNADLVDFHLSGNGYDKSLNLNVKGVKVAGGWGVEMAIPLDNGLFRFFPSNLAAIGFSIHYNDNDSGSRDHKLAWYPDPNEEAWRSTAPLGALVVLTDSQVAYREAKSQKLRAKLLRKPGYKYINNHPGHINILVNGGFDDGLKGWTAWGNHGCVYSVVSDPASESKALLLDNTALPVGANGGQLCSCAFKVFPGEKYRLSFKARYEGAKPANWAITFKNEYYKISPIGTARLSSSGWKTFSYDFTVNNHYEGKKKGTVQLMFSGKTGDSKLWLDDMSLVRYVPEQIDANLSFNSFDNCFTRKSSPKCNLQLKNAGDDSVGLDIKTTIQDLCQEKIVSVKESHVRVDARGAKKLTIDVPAEKNGMFIVNTVISNPEGNNKIIRETGYAIFQPPLHSSKLCNVAIGHHIYLKDGADRLTSTMNRLGLHSARVFVYRQQEYMPGKYDFSTLDNLVEGLRKNGASLVACVSVKKPHGKNTEDNLLEYEKYVTQLARHFKGRIKYYEIGNEVNLWMGWPPESNPIEYSMMLRVGYNAIRAADPQAIITTCGFNRAKLDTFMSDFLSFNKGCFYDVFAFHPYEVKGDPFASKDLGEAIKAIRSYKKNAVIFDTESGVDKQTPREAVEILAKKIPIYNHYGIDRHYQWGLDKMASGHMLSMYGQPGVATAVYPFLVDFYRDGALACGEWKISKDFCIYASRLNDVYRAAIWNINRGGKEQVELAALPSAKVYDAFGNDITSGYSRSDGKLVITLPSEWPVFVTGVLPAANELHLFKCDNNGKLGKEIDTDVVMVPSRILGFFRQNIAIGKEQKLDFWVKNYSGKTKHIRLFARALDGLSLGFKEKEFDLQPGEVRFNKLEVVCNKAIDGDIVINGTADGKPLAEIPVNIKASDRVVINVRGHHVELCNLAGSKMVCDLHFTSNVLDVIPFRLKNVNVSAETSKLIPLSVLPSVKRRMKYPVSGKMGTCVSLISQGENLLKSNISFSIAVARHGKPGKGESKWYNCWNGTTPVMLESEEGQEKFSAGFRARWCDDKIYLAVRIEDSSPLAKGSLGYIGDGDSVIVGVAPQYNSSGAKGYADGAYEAGFALQKDGTVEAYKWNGLYGLESARKFENVVVNATRNNGAVFYDIIIPMERALKAGESIGLSLRFVNLTQSGKLQSVGFGGGLGSRRASLDFGTLNLK